VRRDAASLALVALLYVLAAVAFTWPLALHPASRLAAPIGPGDPYLNLWILGWDLRTIGHDPLAILTGRVFDANIFFPATGTLAYSDHLILQALALWPLYAATGDLVLCYNALLFLSLVASAGAMFVFARAVTGSLAGALLAGLAWGFFPFRFAHLLHLQLQSLYFLPLAFLFLHRVVAARRRRDALMLGLLAGLQAASSVYWAIAAALGLSVAAAALAIGVGRWRSLPLLRRLLLAGVVAALLLAPFTWPYWVGQRREGFSRNLYEAAQHEATIGSYARVPPQNLLYGRTGLLRPAAGAPSPHEGPEQELFPGFVLIALACLGAWRAWRRDARPLAIAMAAVAATGFVLSLGPDGVRWLYAFLHRTLFGFQAVRAPARFGVLVAFAVAVLAAFGARELLAGIAVRARPVAAAVLLTLAGLEYFTAPLPTVPAPARETAVARWLRQSPAPGAVVYLPLEADIGNTRAMVDSLAHGRRIVNGYSGQRPAFFMGLVDALSRFPSAEALWTLRDIGVRYVVSAAPVETSAPTPLVERARFGDTSVYELEWSEEIEAAVPRPEPPPPPDAGPVPFAAEERGVYRVIWLTAGAMAVPAGHAVITGRRVPPGEPGEPAFHVGLELTSADWVRRFFEAEDRFETWADAALLPERQEQRIREGRRRLDRVTRFDDFNRVVTVGDGPPLPMPTAARDGLAGFLYARTLPLAPGYEVRFPIVEGGRQLTAAMRVVGTAETSVNGRPAAAWRLEARFESRSERRPITATLLVTSDQRRIPVEITVDAGFGSFRVELVEYSSR
jgi:hypothetical protein